MSNHQVAVSESALIKRLNRALAQYGQMGEVVRKARSVRVSTTVGDYFIVDVCTNSIAHQDIDLEEWGRDLECLKPWETLATA